jgi:hypothetical protein
MSSLQPSFDAARAEAFAGSLLNTLNGASLSLMISIGHRTGLFDTMSGLPPVTSAELADRAGLNERYVREWLGAMVTGRVVEVDAATGRYSLPGEHAAFLTRAAGADNLAAFTQYIAVLGGVEDDIVECFRNGGGVPYSRFGRFHEVMAEDSGQSVMSSAGVAASSIGWRRCSRAATSSAWISRPTPLTTHAARPRPPAATM